MLKGDGRLPFAWVGTAYFSLYYVADHKKTILLNKEVTHIMRPNACREDNLKNVSAQGSAEQIYSGKWIWGICLIYSLRGLNLPLMPLRRLISKLRCLMDFPGGTRTKEPACQCRKHKRCRFNPWVGKIPWRRSWQPTPVFLPGESMDRGAWRATVHRVAKSRTWLKQLNMHTFSHWGPKISKLALISLTRYDRKY